MDRITRPQKWVCGIVLTMGIVSAVLGLFAEMTRIKSSQIRVVNDHCVYPSSPALVLGILAAAILLVAQVLVTVLGGCTCCVKGPTVPPNSSAASNRSVAIICLVACWITFLNAFALLMAGASLNNEQQQYMWFGGECNVVKPLMFAGGSLLAIATVVLDVIFYLAASAAKVTARNSQIAPNHISLGQPYMPSGYGPSNVNAAAQAFPYSSFTHPPHTQMHVPSDPSAPPGYPIVVTGYPKTAAAPAEV